MSTAAAPVDVADGRVHCACALILSERGVLLGRRSADRRRAPEKWDVFGGHVEAGETLEQALRRELREELDIVPNDAQLFTRLHSDGDAENPPALIHIFVVTRWHGPGPALRGDEHTEMRWCSRSEALELDLAFPDDYPDLLARFLD